MWPMCQVCPTVLGAGLADESIMWLPVNETNAYMFSEKGQEQTCGRAA